MKKLFRDLIWIGFLLVLGTIVAQGIRHMLGFDHQHLTVKIVVEEPSQGVPIGPPTAGWSI